MLKQFKQKKRPGRKQNFPVNKKKTIPDEKEVSESSDSNVSDSEDSDYEELLINGIVNKTKIEDKKPEVKKEEVKPDVKKEEKKEQLLPPPLKLERQETKPIDIPKPQKKKSKKIVIKKYYNYKPKAERLKDKEQKPTPTTQPVSQPTKEIRLNYLGLPMTGENNNTTTRNHMTSKIFNW